MRVMRACMLLLLGAASAPAQSVSFGLKAGLPLRELLAAAAPGYHAATSRYTFGPALTIELPHRLRFETDLLYKRLQYGFPESPSAPAGGAFTSASAARWEVPLLLEYSFRRPVVRPFVGMGMSFNRVTGVGGVRTTDTRFIQVRHRGTKGFVATAGVEARLGVLRIAPEIRVTRWADRNLGVSDAPLHSNLTQAELLIGFRF